MLVGLAVEADRLDVVVVGALVVDLDDEATAVEMCGVQVYARALDKWRGELQNAGARGHGIHAQCRQHVPGRGRAGVVVAGQAIWSRVELTAEDLSYPRLRLVRRPG